MFYITFGNILDYYYFFIFSDFFALNALEVRTFFIRVCRRNARQNDKPDIFDERLLAYCNKKGGFVEVV